MNISAKQGQLVQASFDQVAPVADQVAVRFYTRLFQLDPALRSLFPDEMAQQRDKLMRTLAVAVCGLNQPEALMPILQSLAVRHAGYGVRRDHYATVGAALLGALAETLGQGFSDELREAWVVVYSTLSGAMIEATDVKAG